MTIHVYDIEWDLVDDETGQEVDPKEEGLPKELDLEVSNEDTRDTIKVKLFDKCGFAAKSFYWETITIEDRIKNVLRRYFEVNDNGDTNPEYDDYFTAQDAIDEIHNIVGEI